MVDFFSGSVGDTLDLPDNISRYGWLITRDSFFRPEYKTLQDPSVLQKIKELSQEFNSLKKNTNSSDMQSQKDEILKKIRDKEQTPEWEFLRILEGNYKLHHPGMDYSNIPLLEILLDSFNYDSFLKSLREKRKEEYQKRKKTYNEDFLKKDFLTCTASNQEEEKTLALYQEFMQEIMVNLTKTKKFKKICPKRDPEEYLSKFFLSEEGQARTIKSSSVVNQDKRQSKTFYSWRGKDFFINIYKRFGIDGIVSIAAHELIHYTWELKLGDHIITPQEELDADVSALEMIQEIYQSTGEHDPRVAVEVWDYFVSISSKTKSLSKSVAHSIIDVHPDTDNRQLILAGLLTKYGFGKYDESEIKVKKSPIEEKVSLFADLLEDLSHGFELNRLETAFVAEFSAYEGKITSSIKESFDRIGTILIDEWIHKNPLFSHKKGDEKIVRPKKLLKEIFSCMSYQLDEKRYPIEKYGESISYLPIGSFCKTLQDNIQDINNALKKPEETLIHLLESFSKQINRFPGLDWSSHLHDLRQFRWGSLNTQGFSSDQLQTIRTLVVDEYRQGNKRPYDTLAKLGYSDVDQDLFEECYAIGGDMSLDRTISVKGSSDTEVLSIPNSTSVHIEDKSKGHLEEKIGNIVVKKLDGQPRDMRISHMTKSIHKNLLISLKEEEMKEAANLLNILLDELMLYDGSTDDFLIVSAINAVEGWLPYLDLKEFLDVRKEPLSRYINFLTQKGNVSQIRDLGSLLLFKNMSLNKQKRHNHNDIYQGWMDQTIYSLYSQNDKGLVDLSVLGDQEYQMDKLDTAAVFCYLHERHYNHKPKYETVSLDTFVSMVKRDVWGPDFDNGNSYRKELKCRNSGFVAMIESCLSGDYNRGATLEDKVAIHTHLAKPGLMATDQQRKLEQDIFSFMETSTIDLDKSLSLLSKLFVGQGLTDPKTKDNLVALRTTKIREKFDTYINKKEDPNYWSTVYSYLKPLFDNSRLLGGLKEKMIASLIQELLLNKEQINLLKPSYTDNLTEKKKNGGGVDVELRHDHLKFKAMEIAMKIMTKTPERTKMYLQFLLATPSEQFESESEKIAEKLNIYRQQDIKEENEDYSFLRRLEEINWKSSDIKLMYDTVWNERQLVRTGVFMKMLNKIVEETDENKDTRWESVFEEVFSSVVDSSSPDAQKIRKALHIYLITKDSHERIPLMGMLLGSLDQSVLSSQKGIDNSISPMQAIAFILKAEGTLAIKAGQAAHSHPGLSREYKSDLDHLKGDVDTIDRASLFELMDNTLPADIRSKIGDNVGEILGEGTYYVTVEVKLGTDPTPRVLKLLKSESLEKTQAMKRRFDSMILGNEKKVIVGLAEQKEFKELVPLLKQRIEQGYKRGVIECDVPYTYGILKELIPSYTAQKHKNILGYTCIEKAADWSDYSSLDEMRSGKGWALMDKAKGVPFNKLPEGPEKSIVAEYIVSQELERIFSGKKIDIDRHGMNFLVDIDSKIKGIEVTHIDLNTKADGLSPKLSTKIKREVLFSVGTHFLSQFGSGIKKVFGIKKGKDQSSKMLSVVVKRLQTKFPENEEQIHSIITSILALQDCWSHLKGTQIRRIIKGVLI